jgi:hypothetical protein
MFNKIPAWFWIALLAIIVLFCVNRASEGMTPTPAGGDMAEEEDDSELGEGESEGDSEEDSEEESDEESDEEEE